MRLTRRQLLRLGAAGLASAGALRLTASTPIHADDDPPRLRSDRLIPPSGERADDGLVLGPVQRAPYDFNAAGVFWRGALGDVALRTSLDGRQWSPWAAVRRVEDHAGPDEAPQTARFGDIHLAPGSRYVQVRWRPDPDRAELRPAVEVIDSVDGPSLAEVERGQAELKYRAVARGAPPAVPVISREQWGCDERLRYNSKGTAIWPPEYRVIQKCLVHHTATKLADEDYPAAVRAMYRYHAVTREWGDIGYNFLIDPRGNVYEGRAGGPGVVGGHALQYNWGSVGIALLGDYDAMPVPAAAKSALVRMLAWKMQFLNPHEWSYFADRELPHLLTHRDCLTTECPGDNLYAIMGELRNGVIDLLGSVPQAAARVNAVTITPDRLFVGGAVKIEVTVENVGTATLPTAKPKPGFSYRDTESFSARELPTRRGAFRIGVDLDDNRSGTPYPFRFGLDDALEPGKTAVVTGTIRATAARDTLIWAALLREDTPIGDPRLAVRPFRVQPGQRIGLPFLGKEAK